MDYAKDARRHLPGTLPPSLSGIPNDEAWVRYFLKVTVIRLVQWTNLWCVDFH